MKISNLEIMGVCLIENFEFYDERGGFIKTFSRELFEFSGISFTPVEIYYSISKKNVIRGMHFQIPPKEHSKLIYVTAGRIIDVILDLRKASPTFGKYISVTLTACKNSIYIPAGCAHGFKALDDGICVVYNQTSSYSKEHDSGILWNSFGFDWQTENPILSERDKNLINFNQFTSPF
jgi:dTDP-4-dehydrorhamnose 3,5-epimerase